ncbi:MAG: DUF3828 domain-containing protein [Mesorhizobium sp.]|nr:DUF3828 domain-containing protein [Mesorhizobium sp.]MBN9241448.1 DUF3828 domain-containing protein [Mesorhizobium sp.]
MKLPLALALLPLATPALAGPASDAVKFFYTPEVRFEADAQYRDRFTQPVTNLFEQNDEAVRKNPDQIACIDFDPGLDAQDFDQATVSKTLKLTEALDGDTGTVTATFTLFPADAGVEGASREMIWSVKKIDGQWKIADIASKTSDWTLSQLECMAGQDAD